MDLELSLDSIEAAYRLVVLLSESVVESKGDIESDAKREADADFPRRQDALQFVVMKLEKLDFLLSRSRRVLNDLRSLHRLMFEEREAPRRISTPPPVVALAAPKAVAAVALTKRRALSARVDAQPKAKEDLQIMSWYLRPNAQPRAGIKRVA
jgi:hypothetical protein